jgi:hypothetical protein
MATGDRITYTGLVVVGAAAAVMSFAALAGLAAIAGVVGRMGPLRLAWLLPVAVDAYAATATGVWLRAGVSPATRSWARANALSAIAASVAGNATYHELTAGPSARTWVVVIVAAVPPLMLGAVVHTAVLVSGDRHLVPGQVPASDAGHVPLARSPGPAIGTDAAPGPDREERDRAGAGELTPSRSRLADRERRSAAGPDSVRRLALVADKAATASSPSRGTRAEQVMREHWKKERAAGREPSGAELDRVAGTNQYGRRVRRKLLAEEQQAGSAEPPDAAAAAEAMR